MGKLADTWGALPLKVQAYKWSGAQPYLVEKELLAPYDATSTGKPNSVLMGTGRRRKTLEIEGWATRSDYKALLLDYKQAVSRLLILGNNVSMHSQLWRLEGRAQPGSDLVWYRAVFMER